MNVFLKQELVFFLRVTNKRQSTMLLVLIMTARCSVTEQNIPSQLLQFC